MLLAAAIIAFLILLTALYVAAEFAAVGVRRSRLRRLAEDGSLLATRILPVVESPHELDRYIAASQVGITLSSLILGAYAQASIAPKVAPLVQRVSGIEPAAAESTSAVLVLLALTTLAMILGELVPKSIALQEPTKTALATVLPMQWSLRLFSWSIRFLNGSGNAILKLLGIPATGHRHVHSPDEIELLIAESRDGGLLEPDEHRRLQRALRLNLRQARQLMVPRKRISALSIDTPLNEVVSTVAQSPYSRMPVYRGSIDNIVGILRTKDLVRWFVEGRPGATLAELMRAIPSVHESVTADRVLKDLRERRSHQALVVDEFGGTAGLLTLADVLTELFGHVGDEFRSGQLATETLADGRIRLAGEMGVDDAAMLLETSWETGASSVGGLVTEALGHIPSERETVVVGDYEFEVERVRDRIPQSVIARRVVPVPSEDAE